MAHERLLLALLVVASCIALAAGARHQRVLQQQAAPHALELCKHNKERNDRPIIGALPAVC